MSTMGIASKAMMVELNIGNWTANKLDRGVSEEVDAQKGTTTRAGSYRKNILAGAEELIAIQKHVGNVRNWHYRLTSPWSDSGLRLLTLGNYLKYTTELNEHKATFEDLKRNFVTKYPDLISEMAFKLGSLFNRDDYPSMDQIERKFYFSANMYPLPVSGDWRLDAENEMKTELEDQYQKHFDEKFNGVMADMWDRLHSSLKHLADRLEVTEGADKKTFRDSLIGNANELCGLLSNMNVMNDPKLEQARKELEQAIAGVTAKDLRDSILIRQDVHARVTDIIKKFDF